MPANIAFEKYSLSNGAFAMGALLHTPDFVSFVCSRALTGGAAATVHTGAAHAVSSLHQFAVAGERHYPTVEPRHDV